MLSRTENNISLVIGSWTLRRLTHSDCWSHSDPNDRQPNHRCHRLHRLYRKGPLPDPIGSWPPSSPPEPVGFRAKFWPATVVTPAADYPDIFTVARSTDPLSSLMMSPIVGTSSDLRRHWWASFPALFWPASVMVHVAVEHACHLITYFGDI